MGASGEIQLDARLAAKSEQGAGAHRDHQRVDEVELFEHLPPARVTAWVSVACGPSWRMMTVTGSAGLVLASTSSASWTRGAALSGAGSDTNPRISSVNSARLTSACQCAGASRQRRGVAGM